MIGLIAAVLAGIVVFFYGQPLWGVLIVSAFFFPLALLLKTWVWQPLLQIEQSGIPKLLSLIYKDKWSQAILAWFAIFPLFSIGIASVGQPIGFLVWLLCLGISLDLIFFFIKRLERMIDPFFGVEELEKKATIAIQKQDMKELLDWIDAISEASIQATLSNRVSLAKKTIDIEQKINHSLFSNASLFYELTQNNPEEDLLNYALFYLYQRMDLLFHLCLKEGQEALCSHLVSTFGKAILAGGKCDLSFANDPIHFLGRLSKQALQKEDEDLVLKITLTLSESAKLLLKEANVSYGNLKEPFLNLIGHMRNIAQETFRKNRQTDLSVLIQPFRDLKEAFKGEKISSHQDTPAIVYNLDQVIGEFEALQVLLHTIPPIPTAEEMLQETSSLAKPDEEKKKTSDEAQSPPLPKEV